MKEGINCKYISISQSRRSIPVCLYISPRPSFADIPRSLGTPPRKGCSGSRIPRLLKAYFRFSADNSCRLVLADAHFRDQAYPSVRFERTGPAFCLHHFGCSKKPGHRGLCCWEMNFGVCLRSDRPRFPLLYFFGLPYPPALCLRERNHCPLL